MITQEERIILDYPNALVDKFENNLESEIQNQIQTLHGTERDFKLYKKTLMFDAKLFFLTYRHLDEMLQWLDIGCGSGICLSQMFEWAYNEHIPLTIDAIDIRNDLWIPEHRINFQQMDAQNFQSEPKYHLITSCWALPYMKNQLETLTNIYNALLPRGYAVINVRPKQIIINDKPLGKDIFSKRIKRANGVTWLNQLEQEHPKDTYTIFMEKGNKQLDLKDVIQVYAQRPSNSLPESNTFSTTYMTRRHIRKLIKQKY
ncbi:MAG: class I SAM-dependent methyltransferase [archaeon]